jgi:hypothetical protein
MDEFLRKITLLDHFTIELDVERHVFVDRLANCRPGLYWSYFFSFEGFVPAGRSTMEKLLTMDLKLGNEKGCSIQI